MATLNQPLESKIVRDIIKALRSGLDHPIWLEKIHGGLAQSSAIPDIIGIYLGVGFGLEVKRPGRKATPLQQRTIDDINAAGGIATVVFSVDDAMKIMRKIELKDDVKGAVKGTQNDL